MTYFSDKEWWDTHYKIRRSVSLTPFSFLPGSENLCCVKLKKTDINGKIKPDYSDLNIVYQNDDGDNYLIPYYVVDEGIEISIVFKPVMSIIYVEPATPEMATPFNYTPFVVESGTPTTSSYSYIRPEPDVPASENEYYLYYGGKTENKLTSGTNVLDSSILLEEDFGQLDELTRWTFQKPSIYWSLNISQQPDATATFEFIGHKADLYFGVGPSFGMFEYRVNGSDPITVDCYSGIESIDKVISVETNKIETTKIRIRSLGNKNPAAQSYSVKLSSILFNQILTGESQTEEFYSNIGKTITTGS